MRKVFLSAIAICTFGIANAQSVKFGVKAGANIATLTGKAVADDVSMKVGFNAGGLAEIKFSDLIALQPELLFSMQGARTVDRDNDFAGNRFENERTLNFNYINVPVMLKIYPVKSLFFEAGPQVGFLLSAKAKQDYTSNFIDGTSTVESKTIDIKGDMKTVDLAFNVGVGYEFTENLFINGRYGFGLSNIYKTPDVFPLTLAELDAKNGVISVNLGYKF
jgi:opacity protein-like surface antigen